MLGKMRRLLELFSAKSANVRPLVLVHMGYVARKTVPKGKAFPATWFWTNFALLFQMHGTNVLIEVS